MQKVEGQVRCAARTRRRRRRSFAKPRHDHGGTFVLAAGPRKSGHHKYFPATCSVNTNHSKASPSNILRPWLDRLLREASGLLLLADRGWRCHVDYLTILPEPTAIHRQQVQKRTCPESRSILTVYTIGRIHERRRSSHNVRRSLLTPQSRILSCSS